jgi:serine/threonine protein kinase/tetratricopeptide (TPR) repeat protein
MTGERREQVEQIVTAVLELKDSGRAARLDSLCGGDLELRREVESLLAYEGLADRFLETPALEVAAQSLAKDQFATLTGLTVGPYRIDSLLGSGGMGEVYLGSDTRLRRPVALKFLTRELLHDAAALERFQREARAASALNHPNICVVHDVGDLNGRPFIAMEYLEGQTLRACLRSGMLPRGTALEYAAQTARGLAAAHQRGVVHRDLKPENLWITPQGTVKILDFGLAKVEEPFGASNSAGDSLATEPGRIMGTVGYMSPEQVRGQSVDHRTDLFAFGAILHELITGQRAFRGPSAVDTLSAILNQSAEKLADPGIDQVVRRCLEKDPGQRFQSASEVATVLERLQTTPSAPAECDVPRDQATDDGRRTRRWLLRTGAGAAAGVSLVSVWGLLGWRWPSFPWRPTAPHITRLAVLPFTNLSSDAEQEYFADGMTDILIADLTQIAALRVVSRTSVMPFKGVKRALPEIARQLGVDAVVTATVMKSGQRVRITAELVDGPADKPLWAKFYERDLTDILAMQAEVARAIAGEVQARLTPQEAGRLASSRKIVPAALDAYLLGRYHWDRFTEESLLKSIEYYREAIQLDPEYAAAYSGIAEAWSGLFTVGARSWDEAIPKARQAVTKALALDGSSAEAHHALGFIYYREWNWKGADEETRKAIALSPGYSTCYVLACNLLRHRGRADESIAAAKKAIEVDPLAMITNEILGSAYIDARQYDLAIAQFQKALELHPDDPTLLYQLGWAYVYKRAYDQGVEAIGNSLALEGGDLQLSPDLAYIDALIGKKNETRRILNRLLDLARKYPTQVSPGLIAMVYVALDERPRALAWFEKAYQQHSPMMAWLKVDPRFDSIRPDPAFQDLMRRVGLI